MGTLADSLFSALMSWVRALVSAFWALFSSENTTALEFLGRNWLIIAVVLIAAGLVIDWIVWLIRWQPYHLWARRVRRLLRIEEPEADEEELEEELRSRREAQAARSRMDEGDEDDVRRYMPPKKRAAQAYEDEEDIWRDDPAYDDADEDEAAGARDESWLPLAPVFDEAQEEAAIRAAEDVPDEELEAYPGMRYGAHAQAPQEDAMGGTQRYSAVRSEGPGAAEVERRRAEIDAWQLQMQEEARQKAQAERERLAQEAYEAEQARIAQEAYEAEQARIAQEEYERQLAQYEQQKAQYERDLAEYERQKAIYDAQMAAQAAQTEQPAQDMEAAQELAPEAAPLETAAPARTRRRRAQAAAATYSDMVEGEHVKELPPPPSWPRMAPARQQESAPLAAEDEKDKKEKKDNGFLSRVARMIEPEEEELASLHALPPRVNMKDAYKPARKPAKPGRRNR